MNEVETDELVRWLRVMAERLGMELVERDPGPDETVCDHCGEPVEAREYEPDHETHWSHGNRWTCPGSDGEIAAVNGDPRVYPPRLLVTDEYCDLDAGYCSTHQAWIDEHDWKLAPEQAQAGLEGFAKLAGIVPESAKFGTIK